MESLPSGWLLFLDLAKWLIRSLIRRPRKHLLERIEWHERDGLFRGRKIVVEIYSRPKREE